MKNGLSPDFYKEELREGYLVSAEMKKVWAIELELLEVFSNVCEENNLSYFLDGGTLLGAVRHKGFIPWDDDVDVIMPREDYDKLASIADKVFPYPYFYQSTLTENGFFRVHAQLRHSETTGFIRSDEDKDVNKGIFLDIFVLDNVPDGYFARKWLKREIQVRKKILAYQYDRKYSKLKFPLKIFYKAVHVFFKVYPFKKFFVTLDQKVFARARNKRTYLSGNVTLKWNRKTQWPCVWHEGYVYLPFEHLKLRAPLFYKEILAKQYGDWMKRPEKKGNGAGNTHGTITFAPDIPYKEYFTNRNKKME